MKNRNLEHWFTDKQERLLVWREWRNELKELPLDDVYQEVATWWKFVPLVTKTFDPWRSDTWPDPWTLVGTGSFCPNAQGLGIFYSLVLAELKCELILAMVEQQPKLMVLLPNNQVLNYYDGETVDADLAMVEVLQKWAPSDLANLVKV